MDPRHIGGCGAPWDVIAPRGSPDRTSSWILRLVGVAATTNWSYVYRSSPPLRRCAAESSIGGAEVGSWCVGGAGSVVSSEDSLTMTVFSGCWSYGRSLKTSRSPWSSLQGAGSGYGAAAVTACLQLALVAAMVVVWSEDIAVILFTSWVLCTTLEFSI